MKNTEQLENNQFEVHLFCWEYIVCLIDQNRHTHDWYMRHIDFAANFNVSVTFDDGETKKVYQPELVRNHIHYKASPSKTSGLRTFRYQRSPEEIRESRVEILTEPQAIMDYISLKRQTMVRVIVTISMELTM